MAAASALSEVWTLLATAPWSGPPQNKDNPDGAVRHVLFGPDGAGQVIYLILNDTRVVHVVGLVWLGD